MLRRIVLTSVFVVSVLSVASSAPVAAAGHPVRFVSIQADPPGADDGSNASLNNEWVVLKNYSSNAVKMGSYSVDLGNKEYDFPSGFTLQAGSKVWVHSGKGTNGRHDVYWGRTTYAYPNSGRYAIELWGPGGIQNGMHVVELKDTCMVIDSVNAPC